MINNARYWLAACLLLALLAQNQAQAEVQVLDRIVAVVNDGVIMESELANRVDNIVHQIRADGQQPPPPDIMRRQVLERMIIEEVQQQMANRMGIRIDDNSLNDALTNIARDSGLSLEDLAREVRMDGIEWSDFREQIRREMLFSQLHQRSVGQRVRVTDRELERFMTSEAGRQLFEAEFRLAHILIEVPDAASPEEVEKARKQAESLIERARAGERFSELAVRYSNGPQALEGGDLGWRSPAHLPGLFADAGMKLQPGDISPPLRAPNGYHILLMIDRRGGGSQLIEQYQTRHILIRATALRSGQEAQTLARQLRTRIKQGEDFATLAREYSDDPGSARQGGDLGWISQGDMVDAFAEQLLNTPINTLSPVFQTEFGWHFLRIEDKRTADMSEEFRRMRARQALQQRRFEEELQQWLREQRGEAYVDIRL